MKIGIIIQTLYKISCLDGYFFVIFSKMTYFNGKNRKENYLFLAYDNRYICTRVYAKHSSRGVILKRIVRSFLCENGNEFYFFY